MAKPYTIRWGIMATGGIATTFTKDLMVDPKTRGVEDIVHTVTAVASSSSADSANKFISEIITPKQSKDVPCKAYGSYEELVKDPNIDIVYVATPHSHHFQNCMLALSHNKRILCEKAFTVNAAQAKKLYQIAKEKNLFLMEAVWTRYFPLSIYVRDEIQKGTLGEVTRVAADLSPGMVADEFDKSHRMVNLNLAGGALLDLGVYPLTWVFQTLYHTIPPAERQPPEVSSAMTFYETGADYMTTMVLTFPRSTPKGLTKSHGVAMTAFDISHDPDGKSTAGPTVRIYGTKAELQIFGPPYRPESTRLIPHSGSITSKPFPIPAGHGMFWEADEAARCVRDGKLESAGMPWEESTAIMQVMDQVRKQGGLTYPEGIESTEFPVALPR